MIIERAWAMPSRWTFSIKPIGEWIDAKLKALPAGAVIVDPFCGESTRGTHTNDLVRDGRTAVDFLRSLPDSMADAVLFDPPYSPRQITECYRQAGLTATMLDTSAKFYADAKDEAARVLKPNGVALCFGWNSGGLGMKRGCYLRSVLLVAHGGAHNDTICTFEERAP